MVLAALLFFSLTRGAQFKRLKDAIARLEGTSAQIGVRGDFALIAVVAGVATQLGLETILAAFTVGVIRGMTSGHDELREERLDAVTLGIFIPFFFVDSGWTSTSARCSRASPRSSACRCSWSRCSSSGRCPR